MTKLPTEFRRETKATEEQIKNWEILYNLFENRPLPKEDLFTNLGLYMRSSALAKILFLNELYEQIIDTPGVIVEFGTWWGQNMSIFENLRAIYEPFNTNRRIIGFDTFSGYSGFTSKDKQDDSIKPGSFGVPKGYRDYLEELVTFHEKNNVLGHIKKHRLIEGNVTETVPNFFKKNPETIIALAYFDLAIYEPTKICLETIKPHLVPGSILMLDELNNPISPGETLAFREVLHDVGFTIKKSKYISDRSIIIMK